MRYFLLIAFLHLGVFLYSCQDIEKTLSGIEINHLERGNEKLALDSSVLLLNIYYVDETGRKLFSSEEQGRRLALFYKSTKWGIEEPFAGPFYEVLAACKIKDSITFTLTAEQLYKETFLLNEIPAILELNDTSKINFHVGIDDQMSDSEFNFYVEERDRKAQEQDQKLLEARKAKEDSIIRQYIKANNLVGMTKTESGLWYKIIKQGEGAKPVENDLIVINYDGYYLNDDGVFEPFDSSYDRGEPIGFAFGVRDVFGGWDEGFGLLNMGGSAEFIMPSHLAYGPQSEGVIQPFTILKYNVDLIKIVKRD